MMAAEFHIWMAILKVSGREKRWHTSFLHAVPSKTPGIEG
jgi:hypothetical protein